MRLSYPFAGENAKSLYDSNIKKVGSGFYPVGDSMFWHSGVHIKSGKPVVAVCDGEVIAYRINEDYIEDGAEVKGNEGNDKTFSTGFVLIRHTLKLSPKAKKEVTFYSVYAHLLPWDLYSDKQKRHPPPFFNTSRFYVRKNTLNVRGPECTEKDFDLDQHAAIRQLKMDDEIFLQDGEEGYNRHQTKNNFAYMKLEGKEEYVVRNFVEMQKNTPLKFTTAEKNEVVVLNPPMEVKAGTVIGYPGKYETDNMIHFEIFMEDVGFIENPDGLEMDDPEKEGKNLHNWLSDGYFRKVEDIDDDGFCDIKKLQEISEQWDDRIHRIIMNSKRIPQVATQTTAAEFFRTLVCRHPTEWSAQTDQTVAKWKRLEGPPWFVLEQKVKDEIIPHVKRLQWWDDVFHPPMKDIPDPMKLWYVHPIKFIEHLNLVLREDEIIFVANCSRLGEEKFLVLTPQESDELREEERELTKKIETLKSALEEGKNACEHVDSGNDQSRKISEKQVEEAAKKIKAAKEQVAKALTSHAEGGGFDNLTEIRRLSGKKTTYIRSNKIKNHWRSYSLESDDRKKSLRTKNGRLDKKKLKEQFGKTSKKIQNTFNFFNESLAGHENAFGQYIDELNESLKWSSDENQSNPEEVNFDSSAHAQLLRFYAGAALEGTGSFKEMQFGFSGNANASLAVAEAKLKSRAYWPHKGGYHMCFNLKGKRFDFGRIRAYLEINATAFAGASVVGSVCIEINKPDDKDKLTIRGVNKAGKGIKPDKNTASGKLFIGAEAGGEVVGKCEWDNPDKRSDPKTPAWCEFVAIGYGVKGAAGFGAEVEFKISYEQGRFMFRARAGLVLGLGAGGMVVGAVDAGTIMEFVQFIYHQLKNHGYHFLDAISENAFNRITKLSVWAVETGEDIADFGRDVAQGISDSIDESVNTVTEQMARIEAWWDLRQVSKYEAQKLAGNILSHPDKLKFTTPEAKGILLYKLCETFIDSLEEDQERAIIKILEYVQSQEEYIKVCEHLTENGTKTSFYEGHARIYWILDGKEKFQFLKKTLEWKINKVIDDWETGWKQAYLEKAKKDTPIKTVALMDGSGDGSTAWV